MNAESCKRKGCNGTIEDGYCNVCGLAALKTIESFHASIRTSQRQSASITTGTGSSPLTNRSKGSRRTSSSSSRSSRKQLGAGLVSIPELPSTEPEKAIVSEAKVPDNKRFCSNCNSPLRREKGFCSKFGLAAELAHNYKLAIQMYDLVSRSDPSYTAAAFGLARCQCATGDRKGAVAALERVPQTSNMFTRSRVEIARTLINTEKSIPGAKELKEASTAIEALTLEGMDRYRLTKQVLETALNLVNSQAISPNSSIAILGQTLEEVNLRKGLEKALRAMAHLTTREEKIRLVDEANRVRPLTLF